MSKKESRLVKSSINKREMREMVSDYLHKNQGRQLALKNVFSEMGLSKHPLRMLCVDILNEMLEAGALVKNHDGYLIYRGTAHVMAGTFNRTMWTQTMVWASPFTMKTLTMHCLVIASRWGFMPRNMEIINCMVRLSRL